MARKKLPRALILHDEPEKYLDLIESRFPALDRLIVRSSTEVPDVLASFRPEVVLSFRRLPPGPYPREALVTSPTIKWLHSGGAGTDHIVPWDPKHITITNSSGVHVDSLSQYVVTQIMWFTAGFRHLLDYQRQHRWQRRPMETVTGRLLLVVGMGNIGTGVAKRAKGLGMRVIGFRTRAGRSPHAEKVLPIEALETYLPRADYVALTLPKTKRSANLFDAPMLAKCKPGVFLVNVARGGIVDEAALVAAMKSGHVAGAAFDVFATEPLPPESPLWDLENMIVTPHTGDPVDWERKGVEIFCENLKRYAEGRRLKNIVLPDRGY